MTESHLLNALRSKLDVLDYAMGPATAKKSAEPLELKAVSGGDAVLGERG